MAQLEEVSPVGEADTSAVRWAQGSDGGRVWGHDGLEGVACTTQEGLLR